MNHNKDDGTGLGFQAWELRIQPTPELLLRLKNTREAILNLNTRAAQSSYGRKRHCQQPHYYKGYRRAIARILTILQERNIVKV